MRRKIRRRRKKTPRLRQEQTRMKKMRRRIWRQASWCEGGRAWRLGPRKRRQTVVEERKF